ncbi:MAG: hypothetical protein JXX28_10740 [Deltaproteobacteria bacterium]|nr:hypothetical protein [Deltaproteobacteria bacterium]
MLIVWTGLALAAQVFVNGVEVTDRLTDQTFPNAEVRFDADGNVHIEAPGFVIEAEPAPAEPPPPPSGLVPAGRWWLVTDDAASVGHVVEVWINGRKARLVRSGDPQVILDIAPWLTPGENTVEMKARSAGPSGGPLYVYMGRGANQGGTVTLDHPDVQFGLGASREGLTTRQYTVVVSP